jgi:RNA polymerase sigma-70 factor, ECF subfamily
MKQNNNTDHGKTNELRPNSNITDDDHDVIRQVLKGDVNKYRMLVEKHQRAVFNLCYQMLNNYEDAEELTQDVFVKAYEHLAGFRFKYRFFSWIYRIAINRTLVHIKQQSRQTGIANIRYKLAETDEEENDRNTHLKMAIDLLKENYKTVIILKYYEQLSYKEMSVILEIPEKTIRSRLYDARIKMKQILEDTGYW